VSKNKIENLNGDFQDETEEQIFNRAILESLR
jgi:hypothetical protein